eukprot:334115-Rhodomonas_salina.1
MLRAFTRRTARTWTFLSITSALHRGRAASTRGRSSEGRAMPTRSPIASARLQVHRTASSKQTASDPTPGGCCTSQRRGECVRERARCGEQE